ncbi:MAG: flagellar export chaperone FliS [Spirochaetia bacterium]
MNNRRNPLNAYKETSIRTSSQGKLIIMLYDEAIKQIKSAEGMIEEKSKKMDAVNNAIIRAQDMITELMVSLDFDKGGEIAKNLFSLYMFFNQQLMQANMKKDPEEMKKVRTMLSELRETWQQVIKKTGNQGGSTSGSGVNIAG